MNQQIARMQLQRGIGAARSARRKQWHAASSGRAGLPPRTGSPALRFFALRATPTPSGKFFVYDVGADGVRTTTTGRAGGAVDEVRTDAVRIVRFNGDASGQGLTKTAYAETLTATDARYAQLLTRLPLDVLR